MTRESCTAPLPAQGVGTAELDHLPAMPLHPPGMETPELCKTPKARAGLGHGASLQIVQLQTPQSRLSTFQTPLHPLWHTEPGWGIHPHSPAPAAGTQPLLILMPAAVEPLRSTTHASGAGKPPKGTERAGWQQPDGEVRATALQRCPCCSPAAIPGHRHSLPDLHPAWTAAPAPGAQGHKARRDLQEDRGQWDYSRRFASWCVPH